MSPVRRVMLLRLAGSLVRETGHPRNVRPPYPLKYVEALLRGDRRCALRLHDAQTGQVEGEPLMAGMRAWRPDVLVVQATTLESDSLTRVLDGLDDLPSVRACLVVGQIAHAMPPMPRPRSGAVVGVVVGEPELHVVDVIRRLDAGIAMEDSTGPAGTAGSETAPLLVEDPDALPFPAWSPREILAYRMHYPLPLRRRVRWGHVLSSRGCPNRCLFCSPVTRESYGSRMRLRAPGRVVEEVLALGGFAVNVVCFDDDDFTASRGQVEALCEGLRPLADRFRWVCHARVDDLDGALIETMAASGCAMLRIGVEAASERVLTILRKGVCTGWQARAREVFAACRRFGVGTTALFLLGNPEETCAEALATVDLALDLQPDLVQFHYFTPYPGSAAWALYEDRLPSGTLPHLYHYRTPLHNPSAMDTETLRRLYRDSYRRFFARPEFLLGHARKFKGFYLRNPDIVLGMLPRFQG